MTGSTCCRQDRRAVGARACTEVMDPFLVVVMRSCRPPRSVASVGWYPTADGMRPSSADTSELACRAHATALSSMQHIHYRAQPLAKETPFLLI